jgi:hypothetical protein
MDLSYALHNLGAAITLLLGALGMLSPRRAARFASVVPSGRMGLSEIRATYGGFFAALGAFALVAQDMVAFMALGAAWVGAAAARTASLALDRSLELRNFGGILFEAGIGILLLFPA